MINYIIQVMLFQALFLAVYDLFLRKETFFKWNRSYLLVTSLLSFIIPLLKFETFQKAVSQEYFVQLPTVFLNPQEVIIQTTQSSSTLNYLSIIFYVGVTFFALLFLIKLTKIFQLIALNKVIKKQHYSLVLLEKKQAAFSFFNYIFINESLLKNEDLQIIKHELIHCKQFHTLDLLFFELLKIIVWFNPMVYVYQKRITLLHEYISDAEVVKETDKKVYFNKLLAETFNVENISFINQFFKHSLIKKRIVMITKNKSEKIMQLKYLLIVPLLIVMLILSSFENKSIDINDFQINSIDEINADQSFEAKLQLETAIVKKNDTIIEMEDVPFAIIEEAPIFPGCNGNRNEIRTCLQDGITKFVATNFNSNLAKSLNLKPGVSRIIVMFKIDKSGDITDVVARAAHIKLEEEAIRVIKSLPKMKPGRQKGKVVGVKYSLPIAFKVDKPNNVNDTEFVEAEEVVNTMEVPFAIIDYVPIYPGCKGTQEEMRKCIQESITAHVSSSFNSKLFSGLGLQPGVKRIMVMFKIDKEGNIVDLKARAPHVALEEEAIRVVNSLPKMIPGKNKGEVVDVKYALPIAFKID